MKKYLLYLLFLPISGYSQTSDYRHEIGTGLFTMHEDYYDSRLDMLSGIFYKYHYDHFNIRAGVSYWDYSHTNDFEYQEIDHVDAKNITFNIGIEKTFFKGWFKQVEALDLIHITEFYDEFDGEKETRSFNMMGGLGGSVGFNIAFSSRLSLTMETQLQVVYASNGGFGDWDINYVPIRMCTLNFHL